MENIINRARNLLAYHPPKEVMKKIAETEDKDTAFLATHAALILFKAEVEVANG